jgi:multidrug efflux system membrane fusion protein
LEKSTHMKKFYLRLLFLLYVVLFMSSCGRREAPSLALPKVTVSQPIAQKVVEWDEYTGRLEAVESVEVRARVSGYLESVHFEDGAMVKKGDLLFVIDPRPYQAELERAQAEHNRLGAKLELAINDFKRADALLKTKAISEEEFDTRSKAKREAEAAVEAAQAAVTAAKLNLDYTQIAAPIAGRIGRKLITEGNLVNGSVGQATLLTTIVSQDPIYCYVDADEQRVLKYQQLAVEGKRVSARHEKVPCELALANEEGFPHKGVIDFVDNRLDPNTGTLRARGVFPNPDGLMTPGFFARLRVTGRGEYDALLVPDEALGTDQSQKFVYVVNPQNVVEYRVVKTGPLIDGLRVITQGLQAEDWVVVKGIQRVRPDVKVELQKESLSSVGKAETSALEKSKKDTAVGE